MTTTTASQSLRLNPDVIFSASASNGYVTAKDGRKDAYFRLSSEEWFLLNELAAGKDPVEVCGEYRQRFADDLDEQDLEDFLELARGRGLLTKVKPADAEGQEVASETTAENEDSPRGWKKWRTSRPLGSLLLYSRVKLWNPDALFTRLTPKLEFLWTRPFVIGYLVLIAAAALVALTNLHDLSQSIRGAFSLRSMLLVWGTIVLVTILHECAHGMTCKRFGGSVKEIGLLFMFLTPCMYCNVSDAWLFPRRSHRLYVTVAGTLCDFVLWAFAVFAWRCFQPGTLLYQIAIIVVSVCGTRWFLNLNPFLRLDGYYVLVDLLDAPNLRRNGWESWTGLLRSLLFGTPAANRSNCRSVVMGYGAISWSLSLVGVTYATLKGASYAGEFVGLLGVGGVMYLSSMIYQRLFRGFTEDDERSSNEVLPFPVNRRTMLLGVGILGLALLPIKDRSTGTFQVRPTRHADVPSPVIGFIRQIHVEEGQHVEAGQLLADIEIPELAGQIRQKEAELLEAKARLRGLLAGTRVEELQQQRDKVERTRRWRDLAQSDLLRTRQALTEALSALDKKIAQLRSEVEYAREVYVHAHDLYSKGAFAGQQLKNEKKRFDVAVLELQQVESQRRQTETSGMIDAERELERRNKELADAESALDLLRAGTRPELIEAEQARVQKLDEELKGLLENRSSQQVRAPIAGTIATPRIKEKLGAFANRGDVLCVIDDTATVNVEVTVSEQDIAKVQAEQSVEFVARALPFQRFYGQVVRIAPKTSVVATDKTMGQIVVYCRLSEGDSQLLSGMSGFARILRDRRPLGMMAGTRLVKFLRTELWF